MPSQKLELLTTPAMTIYRSGALSLNRAAYLAFAEPAAVELLFDRAARSIGLRGVDGRLRHAYPVRMAESGRFVVSALAFLRFYDLLVPESVRWPATMIDGVLSIDLSRPGRPVHQVSLR